MLGAADSEGHILGLLFGPVLMESEADGCRDGFFDIDGASLGNE